MRKHKYAKGNIRFRQLLINEAAKLMYEEDVGQYHTAKWLAAKRLLSKGGSNFKKIRTKDLPSNGEISEAVYRLALLHEGDAINHRLFEMRITALDAMEKLASFEPRLIGSVSTGRIKKTSDIDLHVFTDEISDLLVHLEQLSWPFEQNQITINYNGKWREFTHIYIQLEFPLELSVYARNELRVRGRSSTDGKPIERFSYQKLLGLIEAEHNEQWQAYIQD